MGEVFAFLGLSQNLKDLKPRQAPMGCFVTRSVAGVRVGSDVEFNRKYQAPSLKMTSPPNTFSLSAGVPES